MDTIAHTPAGEPRLVLEIGEHVLADSTEQDSLLERLERLETAHQLLLRYARDLKDAYEAERERRARLSQSTLELATLLAATLTDPE